MLSGWWRDTAVGVSDSRRNRLERKLGFLLNISRSGMSGVNGRGGRRR